MKLKALYTFVLILSTFMSYSQKIKTEQVYFPYPDPDQISCEYSFYKKGHLNIYHGVYKSYFLNGKPHIIAKYADGKPIEEYKEFYESGSIYIFEKYDKEGNNKLVKYFENGNEMLVSKLINNETIILKRGFENGNYVLYKENNELEYYNSSNELINKITNNDKNNIRVNNGKVYKIHYPHILIDYEKEGVVIVELSIEKNGVISKLNILESFDPLASKNVLSVLENIPPEDLKSESKQEIIQLFEFILN